MDSYQWLKRIPRQRAYLSERHENWICNLRAFCIQRDAEETCKFCILFGIPVDKVLLSAVITDKPGLSVHDGLLLLMYLHVIGIYVHGIWM
jgi:hypothetical protein